MDSRMGTFFRELSPQTMPASGYSRKKGLASGQSTETELAVSHALCPGITAPLQKRDSSVQPRFLLGQSNLAGECPESNPSFSSKLCRQLTPTLMRFRPPGNRRDTMNLSGRCPRRRRLPARGRVPKPDQRRNVLCRGGSRKQESLHDVAFHCCQGFRLFFPFHAFCHHLQPKAVGQRQNCANQRSGPIDLAHSLHK